MALGNENLIAPSTPAEGVSVIKKRDWFNTVAQIGELLFKAAKSIAWKIVYSILWLIAAFLRGWDRTVKFFKKIAPKLAAPFKRYIMAFKMNRAEIASAKSKGGFFKGAAAAFRVTKRLLFGKRGLIVTAANWILPILSCIFLFKVVAYANNQNFALKLTVNGDFIGYIENETVFTNAENMVQKRINYSGSSTEVISFAPAYEIDTIGNGAALTVYQVTDKILALVSDNIERGYGLYIGGEYYGTLTEHGKVDTALEDLLNQYRSDSEKESVKFDKDITYVQGMFMADSFVDEDEMISTLTSKRQVSTYYTVEDGDSPGLIAKKVGLTMDELDRLNDGFTLNTPVYTGERIKITQDVPFLSIMITREEHYTEVIEYEVSVYNDPNYYEGFNQIATPGVNGECAVTANVSYINNIEVDRTVISSTVTKKPVTQVVHVGTAAKPDNAGAAATVPAGQFYWPVGGYGGGKISQAPYGHGGYAVHTGVDIAAAYATPVFAGANGTIITLVDDGPHTLRGGYGNYIAIQHDNGLVTLYAHLSSTDTSVYKGKRVTMGECIGYVGSTGNSTGNHLHFEVRYNGVWQNPLNYLPAHAKQPGVALY